MQKFKFIADIEVETLERSAHKLIVNLLYSFEE